MAENIIIRLLNPDKSKIAVFFLLVILNIALIKFDIYEPLDLQGSGSQELYGFPFPFRVVHGCPPLPQEQLINISCPYTETSLSLIFLDIVLWYLIAILFVEMINFLKKVFA